MGVSPRRNRPARRSSARGPWARPEDPAPMVEIALSGVPSLDAVTAALRTEGASFRLLACRPSDRGRRRLLRLFEVQTRRDGIGPVVQALRGQVTDRDLAVAHVGPDRALVRVSTPMPGACAEAFELGDFCISCPFVQTDHARERATWNLLVPRIADARRLLSASATRGGARASLVRAGAYRRRWGLTGRQEKALRTAFELGYFDYPRKTSLGIVASRLGVGRSTALELLRKGLTKVAAERFLASPPAVELP
jgi:HTH DNA binding domain